MKSSVASLLKINACKILSLFLLLVFYSCNNEKPIKPRNNNETTYAKQFQLSYNKNSYSLSYLDPLNEKYFLYKLSDSSKPIQRIICMSTTHIGFIKTLKTEDKLIGIGAAKYIFDSTLYKSFVKGKLFDAGYEQNISIEKITTSNPDILFNYGIPHLSIDFSEIFKSQKINHIYISEFLEHNPLARAEWIKVFGLVLNKKPLADSLFNTINEQYNLIKNLTSKSLNKPKIITGVPYHGVWYVPCADSYMATLIKDAGGIYVFEDKPGTGSIPISIEEVIIRAKNADIWLNPDQISTIQSLELIDNRLKIIKALQTKNIYSNLKRVAISGGNDYYESGVVNPHIILRDMQQIFTNETDSLVYFKKLN